MRWIYEITKPMPVAAMSSIARLQALVAWLLIFLRPLLPGARPHAALHVQGQVWKDTSNAGMRGLGWWIIAVFQYH